MITLAELTERLALLYRPSPRGHWQRRIQTLVREWLAQDDLQICWSPDDEALDTSAVRLSIPGREHAPRWIGFSGPLPAGSRRLAEAIATHLAVVADVMSRHASPADRTVPARWANLLTGRQIEVAVLAAAGLHNRQIGEELSIAPRTVARLLQEAYQRLSLNSRAELAAECALGRPPTPVEMRTPVPFPRDDTPDDAPDDPRGDD